MALLVTQPRMRHRWQVRTPVGNAKAKPTRESGTGCLTAGLRCRIIFCSADRNVPYRGNNRSSIFKNQQPISVGVCAKAPSPRVWFRPGARVGAVRSDSCGSRKIKRSHGKDIHWVRPMNVNSVLLSRSGNGPKPKDRTKEFDPGSD